MRSLHQVAIMQVSTLLSLNNYVPSTLFFISIKLIGFSFKYAYHIPNLSLKVLLRYVYTYIVFFLSSLKLLSTICYQIFVFSPDDSSSKTEKCFLFHLKSSFRSQDIQIFVIFCFPFLFPNTKGQMEVE